MNYIYYIAIILIILSCSNKKECQNDKTNNYNKLLYIDSVKSSLKNKIIKNYLFLPKTELSKENNKYNNYIEVKTLDSLFDIYSSMNLTDDEKEYLRIFKAKRYIITGNYNESIKLFHKQEMDNEFSTYDKILIGITYKLNGDKKKSNLIFKELLSNLNSFNENDINFCSSYILIVALSGDYKLVRCKGYQNELNKLLDLGFDKLILDNFLNSIEL